MDDSDEEKRIMSKNWKKLEDHHLTEGFREGALEGKDTEFQSGFDLGYKDGYQKAYDVGLKHGQEKAMQFVNKIQTQATVLNRELHRELCLTCKTTITNKPHTN